MKASNSFRVEPIEYAIGMDALRAVREAVFVQEQNVPLELERDDLDAHSLHVIARDADGKPIGTGRLTPEHTIGRMAVLRGWRGKGVGDALLAALIELAKQRGWRALALNAQVTAFGFYARHGFVPHGPRFMEAGIEHQAMHRQLEGATAIETLDAAVTVTTAIISATRRNLCLYTRDLDPGLFEAPEVLEALRRLATAGHGGGARSIQISILLQDAATPQRAHAPLLPLAQRLPSVFALREVSDPADRAYPSAFIANDRGGYYFRTLGHRFDGDADLQAPGRARQLMEGFKPVWERSRPCTEYRALGF